MHKVILAHRDIFVPEPALIPFIIRSTEHICAERQLHIPYSYIATEEGGVNREFCSFLSEARVEMIDSLILYFRMCEGKVQIVVWKPQYIDGIEPRKLPFRCDKGCAMDFIKLVYQFQRTRTNITCLVLDTHMYAKLAEHGIATIRYEPPVSKRKSHKDSL